MDANTKEVKSPALQKLLALSKKKTPLETVISLSKKTTKKKSKRNLFKRVNFKKDKHGRRLMPFKGKKVKDKLDDCDISDDECCDNVSFSVENNDPCIMEEKIQLITAEASKHLNGNLVSKYKRKRSWKKRVESFESGWVKAREHLLSATTSSYQVGNVCLSCNINPPTITCNQCPEIELCRACDIERHRNNPFHNRISFINGFKKPITPMEIQSEDMQINSSISVIPLIPKPCFHCGSRNVTKDIRENTIIIVTLNGKYELNRFMVNCFDCGSISDPLTLETIIKSGYWPSSPKSITMLYKQDLFRFYDQLRKMLPGSSESAFIGILNSMTDYHGRVGKITPFNFSEAFKEWCFCQHELDKIMRKTWIECPCCTIKQHSSHVDGNCKLYRYHSSGSRRRANYYQDLFIVDDSKVSSFVNETYKNKTPKNIDISCGGNWKAAKNALKKKQSVDVTGLEVMSCRHQFGQKALNMTRGEIYGYPMYLIKHHMLPNKVEFAFADIMCKLWSFMKRVDSDVTSNIKGALSVMHAKGHNLDCQVLWDGEWVKGTGRSTGEETEQVFSFLSRFGNTTKYQRPENREETLTEVMMHWNQQKTLNLPGSLAKKYERVKKDLSLYQGQLKLNLRQNQLVETDMDYDDIMRRIRGIARKAFATPDSPLTKTQNCILFLKETVTNLDISDEMKAQLQRLPNLSVVKITRKKCSDNECRVVLQLRDDELKREIKRLEERFLAQLQKEIERTYFQKVHWNVRMKKVADTCKLRFVYRKKMDIATTHLKLLLSEYNKIAEISVRFEDVDNGTFPWTLSIETSLYPSDFTDVDKKALLELKMKVARCEEELALLTDDMSSYITYYVKKSEALHDEITMAQNSEVSVPSEGRMHLLREGYLFSQLQLQRGIESFSHLLDNTAIEEDIEEEHIEEETTEVGKDEDEATEELVDEIDNHLVDATGRELLLGCDVTLSDGSIMFPPTISQASINGRAGSSACTTISVITGKFITAPFQIEGYVNVDIAHFYAGCIEIGNVLHGVNGFLSTYESLQLLPDTWGIEITIECNCFVNDLHQNLLETFENSSYIVVTTQGQSICCMKSSTLLIFFDSHGHVDAGALITSHALNDFGSTGKLFSHLNDDHLIYICGLNVM